MSKLQSLKLIIIEITAVITTLPASCNKHKSTWKLLCAYETIKLNAPCDVCNEISAKHDFRKSQKASRLERAMIVHKCFIAIKFRT